MKKLICIMFAAAAAFLLCAPASAVKLDDALSSQTYETKLEIGKLLVYALEDRSPRFFDRSDYNEEDLLYYLLVMHSQTENGPDFSTGRIDPMLTSIYGVQPSHGTKYGGADGFYADPGVSKPSDGSVPAPEITRMVSLPDSTYYVEFYGGYAYIEKGQSGWSFVKYGTGFTLSDDEIIANMKNPPPIYSYEDVTGTEPDMELIASASYNAVGGDIWYVYRVTDELYYTVVRLQNSYGGVLIKKVTTDGKLSARIVVFDEESVDSATIDSYAAKAASESNVTISPAETAKCKTTSDYVTYLAQVLDNVDGLAPNDPAMAEITEFVTAAVASGSKYAVTAEDNAVTVSYSDVSAAISQVKNSLEVFRVFLSTRGLEISVDDIPAEVVMDCRGMELTKNCDITISDRIFGTIATTDLLELSFGTGAPSLRFTAEALKAVVGAYGDITIRCRQLTTGVYKIHFLDKDGAVLQAINSPATIRMASANGADSVFVRRLTGDIEPIEGYYRNDISMTEFSAKFSGVYAFSEAGAMTEEPSDDIEPEETEAPQETEAPAQETPAVSEGPESGMSVGGTIKLFMYIGIGLLAVCAIGGAVIIIFQRKNRRNSRGRHQR